MIRVWGALLLFSSMTWGWTLVEPDIKGWKTSELTIHINPENCSVSEDKLVQSLDAAIVVWNQANRIQLKRSRQYVDEDVTSFMEGESQTVPVMICDPDFYKNHGVDPQIVPAATRVSASHKYLDYAAIFLNDLSGSASEISRLSSQQLTLALAHEIGHVLGLGHSDDEEAMMYYSISGKTEVKLSQDDLNGLSALYPNRHLQSQTVGPKGCAAIEMSQRKSNSFSSAIYLFGVLAVNYFIGRKFFLKVESRVGS